MSKYVLTPEDKARIQKQGAMMVSIAQDAYDRGDYQQCLRSLGRYMLRRAPASVKKAAWDLRHDACLAIAQSKTPAPIGWDRWGFYYDLTGHEIPGQCFWCGCAVKNKRYCSHTHAVLYKRHFSWQSASYWCTERYKARCADCGRKAKYPDSANLAVHHIVPLNAEERTWHWLNRPENLVLLCGKCHMTRHKELNYLLRKVSNMEKQVDLKPEAQLALC